MTQCDGRMQTSSQVVDCDFALSEIGAILSLFWDSLEIFNISRNHLKASIGRQYPNPIHRASRKNRFGGLYWFKHGAYRMDCLAVLSTRSGETVSRDVGCGQSACV
jgi:hypothetical protein